MGLELTLEAECFQEIEAHIDGKPLNLCRIPERFSQHVHYAIQGCLERDPEERITAVKLAENIRGLLDLMKHGMDGVQNKSFLTQKWR